MNWRQKAPVGGCAAVWLASGPTVEEFLADGRADALHLLRPLGHRGQGGQRVTGVAVLGVEQLDRGGELQGRPGARLAEPFPQGLPPGGGDRVNRAGPPPGVLPLRGGPARAR